MTKLTPKPVSGEERGTLVPPVDPIVDLPMLILYPHNRCNCRCTMCEIWRIKSTEEITPSDVHEWLPAWKAFGVRRVVLSGGEPLMHSDLWSFCEPIRAAGIDITILSTGLLLTRYATDLVRFCDDVVVSLDGPEATHNEIRRVDTAFAKLAAGVSAVKALDDRLTVSARCTVQRRNFREMCETVAAARQIDVDHISFLAVDVSTEAFNREQGIPQSQVDELILQENELPDLAREIDELETRFASEFAHGFIVESPQKLRQRIYAYFAALVGQRDFPEIQCNAPWVSSVIESDGTVRPCFFQPPLGNIYETGSLSGVLNSAEAIAWRRGLDVARDKICRKCVCSLALRR